MCRIIFYFQPPTMNTASRMILPSNATWTTRLWIIIPFSMITRTIASTAPRNIQTSAKINIKTSTRINITMRMAMWCSSQQRLSIISRKWIIQMRQRARRFSTSQARSFTKLLRESVAFSARWLIRVGELTLLNCRLNCRTINVSNPLHTQLRRLPVTLFWLRIWSEWEWEDRWWAGGR